MSPTKLNTETETERRPDPERDAMIADMEREKAEREARLEAMQQAREDQQREVQAVGQAMANAVLLFYQGKTGERVPQVDGYVLLHASLNLIGSHAMQLKREDQCKFLGTAIAMLSGPLHSPPLPPEEPPPEADGQEPQVEVVSQPH